MPLCMRSTMRPHDIVTPTDLAKINQVRSKLNLRNGNWIFWKIKRSDKPPLIPWKYEVNTLKCILPLSWCIQMGSDNIESRATATTTPKPIMERFLHQILSKLKSKEQVSYQSPIFVESLNHSKFTFKIQIWLFTFTFPQIGLIFVSTIKYC